MIGRTVSHYRILEERGRGGMGVVYRAEDTRLQRTVALKFLSPELTQDESAKKRFINEARAASQLDHPNICTIHEIEETDDGQIFLVLSCYEGETVDDRLAKGPMPIDEAVGMALHVARGLEKAHEKGIIHRDIKPGNIFLTDDGRAKILDFGLAKLADQTKLTKLGSTMGTVGYMSPEQARGGEVDARTDVWSLGVVLYEAVSGEPPFKGERVESVLYEVVHEEAEPLTEMRQDTPEALAAIVNKCLKKDREERFSTVGELAAALEDVRGGRPTGSSLIEIGSTTMIKTRPRRRRWRGVAALVLLLGILGIGVSPPGRDALTGAFGCGRLPDLRQVAVLPFENGGDEADDALVEGLRHYLTFRLSQLERFDPSFFVIPATELERQRVATPAEALGRCGAKLAVEGRVTRNESRVVLRLVLINTESGHKVDSWTHHDDLANVASFQEDLVLKAAREMGLSPQEQSRRVLSNGCTTVPTAFEEYIEGLGRLHAAQDDSTDHVADAVSRFREAVAHDASYALAHVGLAQAYNAAGSEEDRRRAAESARNAVRLSDRLAAAHVTLGSIEMLETDYSEGDYASAAKEFSLALRIDPVNLEALKGLAEASDKKGDSSLAELTYKRATEVRPHHWSPYYALGYYYYDRGRDWWDDALREFSRASDLVPGNSYPVVATAAIHFDWDNYATAAEMFERQREITPNERYVLSGLGTCYFVLLRYADAVDVYEEAVRLAVETGDESHETWGNLAAACNVVPGKEERARESYTRAIELAEEQLRSAPPTPGILASLASYTATVNDSTRARGYLRRAIELHPDDERTMLDIGLAYEELRDRDAALLWIVRAVESGFSRSQVEGTPGLRDLCTDQRYKDRVALLGEGD